MNAGWGDFTLEIWWISPWNLVDFNHEIWWIFTQIWPVKSTQNYKSKCFSKNSSVWWMQGGGYDQGFHEIHQISPWNLVDFTCEIPAEFTQISSMKSTQNYKSNCFSKNFSVWWMQGGGYDQGFHEICWISREIHWISWNPLDFTWNPPDFMKSAGFHVKSTGFHEIRQISGEIKRPLCKEL